VIPSQFMKSKETGNLRVTLAQDNGDRPHFSRTLTGGSPAHINESAARGGSTPARRTNGTSIREASKMVVYSGTATKLHEGVGPAVSTEDLRLEENGTPDNTLHEKLNESDTDPRTKILTLYDEFRPRLFRYMRSLHLAQDQADEVSQETFMRLTAELLKKAHIENVPGWIVRVAHNLAIDLLKREQGPVITSESAEFLIGNRVDPSLNPEDAYAKKEQSRRMTNALSTLNPQHRQCFQMRAQGLRYRDIGLALGISEQRAAFVVKQVAVRLAAICG
jgi:RNA polymerase sigma-70 factor, ECF subfamily